MPCPNGNCGPVEDASDCPEQFPFLAVVDIPPYQLGRCQRCGRYWQWIPGEHWQPFEVPAESG